MLKCTKEAGCKSFGKICFEDSRFCIKAAICSKCNFLHVDGDDDDGVDDDGDDDDDDGDDDDDDGDDDDDDDDRTP